MNSRSLLFVLLVFTTKAFSADLFQALENVNGVCAPTENADHCSHLAELYSCTDQKLDDGTGVSQGTSNGDEIGFQTKLINEKRDLIIPDIKAKVANFLSKLNDAEVKQLQGTFKTNDPEVLTEKLSEVYSDSILINKRSCTSLKPNNPNSCDASKLTISRADDEVDKNIFQEGTSDLHKKTKLLQKDIFEVVKEKIIPSKVLDRLENTLFPTVKKLVLASIDEKFKPKAGETSAEKINREAIKAAMKGKVQSIWYQGIDCNDPVKSRKSDPDKSRYDFNSLTSQNAIYDPAINGIRICSGSIMANSSDFSIITTLAHEMSHSIDPTNIALPTLRGDPAPTIFKYSQGEEKDCKQKIENEFPFKGIINCLRSKDSIAAKLINPKEDAPKEQNTATNLMNNEEQTAGSEEQSVLTAAQQRISLQMLDNQKLKKEAAAAMIDGGLCLKSYTDTMNEAFGDWMAAEVLPKAIREVNPGKSFTKQEFIKGYANTNRGDCKGDDPAHPSAIDRVNQLMLNNPQIRIDMGCFGPKPERSKYCQVQ